MPSVNNSRDSGGGGQKDENKFSASQNGGINVDTPKPPSAATIEKIRSNQFECCQPGLDSEFSKSRLNADAPEFYPDPTRCYTPQPYLQSTAVSSWDEIGDSASFYASSPIDSQSQYDETILSGFSLSEAQQFGVLEFCQYILCRLSSISLEPSMFGELSQALVVKINSLLPNHEVDHDNFLSLVRLVFEHVVLTDNFSYTGAKLVKYLADGLKVQVDAGPDRGNFLEHLLRLCRIEFEKCNTILTQLPSHPQQSFADILRLRRYAYFLAELFLVMKTADGGRIQVLYRAVHDIIRLLMTTQDPANVKCAAQILKMCGKVLEETEDLHDRSKPMMEDHLSRCRALIGTFIDGAIANLLQSVLQLRSTEWGGMELPTTAAAAAAAAPNSVDKKLKEALSYDQTMFSYGIDLADLERFAATDYGLTSPLPSISSGLSSRVTPAAAATGEGGGGGDATSAAAASLLPSDDTLSNITSSDVEYDSEMDENMMREFQRFLHETGQD